MQTITYTAQGSTTPKVIVFSTKDEAADWLFEQDQITIVKMDSTPGAALNGPMQTYKLTDDHGYRGTIGMRPIFALDYTRKHPTHTLELV
jgi:hypothetical protein